jgi:hypothetical protein
MAQVIELSEVELEPVRNFLSETLKGHIAGQSTQYTLIVQQIRDKDDPDTLYQILVIFKSFISVLTSRYILLPRNVLHLFY